ncbi:hypothetical protein Dimus_015067, partial [Dionaea muscipula]
PPSPSSSSSPQLSATTQVKRQPTPPSPPLHPQRAAAKEQHMDVSWQLPLSSNISSNEQDLSNAQDQQHDKEAARNCRFPLGQQGNDPQRQARCTQGAAVLLLQSQAKRSATAAASSSPCSGDRRIGHKHVTCRRSWQQQCRLH